MMMINGKSARAVPQLAAGSAGGQGLADLPPQKGILAVAAREVSHGIVRSSAHLSDECGMSIGMGIEKSSQQIGAGIGDDKA